MADSSSTAKDAKKPILVTPDEHKILLEKYNKNKSGNLDDDEIAALINDVAEGKIEDDDIKRIIVRFDENKDGKLDHEELKVLKEQIKLQDTAARYAGYTVGLSRLFRYLAFTSDFGEALRPVVSKAIVNGTYAVAIGYCFTDVYWEAYKLRQRGYKTDKGEPMSMSQLVIERSTFQVVASVALPFAIIHTAVDGTKHMCHKVPSLKRFAKWGPSIVGLSIIPLLPLYLDEPVEHAIEYVFENYGPWAGGKKKHH